MGLGRKKNPVGKTVFLLDQKNTSTNQPKKPQTQKNHHQQKNNVPSK